MNKSIDKKEKYVKNKWIFILLLLYIIINIAFITKFPFVHSDESWLSGLSRNMMEEKKLSVTETFFDLFPRNPHAIKIIFHIIQIIFQYILGYNIFTFRIISLIFGILTIIIFYKLCIIIFKNKKTALLVTSVLAVDIQFIYSAHFARQEIILVFINILTFYLFSKNVKVSFKDTLIIGLCIGVGIGIHPNSFIIAIPIGLFYLYNILISKKNDWKDLFLFIFVVFICALFFVILSFHFDPNFIKNYSKFGNQFGVNKNIISKISQIKNFYIKIFYQISGTYYMPNIRYHFFIFVFSLLWVSIKYFKKNINRVVDKLNKLRLLKNSKFKAYLNRRRRAYIEIRENLSKGNNPEIRLFQQSEMIAFIFLSILGINIGYIIIGRYNQTSIIFLIPYIYLLFGFFLNSINKKSIGILLLVFVFINSVTNIMPYLNNNYEKYINEISKEVPSNSKVLANLNSEYYFKNGCLIDYRNLDFLYENNIIFEEYIYDKKIEYIIYPEEMDFIYNKRPVWNIIYGNLYPYYKDMNYFLEVKCELVKEFSSPYAMRIIMFTPDKEWKIKIYKVK